jgi:tRNA pseudouridine38-40 synthase
VGAGSARLFGETSSVTLFDDGDGAGVAGPTVRVRLVVAYDGSGFHGFAATPGVPTVAGALGDALARVLGHPVSLSCAGRTDRGVHAAGQVVSFDARAEDLDLERVQRSVNKLCAPAVVVREASVVPDTFDARHSATARRYRYTVLNTPVPDPLLAGRVWWVGEPLELAALRLGCDPLIGEHDFTSFCKVPRGVETFTMVRRVVDARWVVLDDGLLRFDIEASSFCQQMVRSIVGLLVDVGRGKARAGDVAAILRARDRSLVRTVAPPHGLVLWEVLYG